jgi:1-pyrroline-5-carboxylate dehydrogenase
MDWRPLEGFVLAVTPFNFLSIAANLPTAPALMGNTVVWKPASSAVYPAYFVVELLEEAGLPPGVINFVPGAGSVVGNRALSHEDLAGVHFTGSTDTFRQMWQVIARTLEPMKSWPRIVGETGGKNFIFAHPSADVGALVVALLRGAFEYQGQKCSAASRCYVPESLWSSVRERLCDEVAQIHVGDVRDTRTFMGAVIDRHAFERLSDVLAELRGSPDCEILVGGEVDDSVGYFVHPTVVEVKDPHHRAMTEEFFGPVLACFVYPDGEYPEMLEVCSKTSAYGLTGAIFARDRKAIALATERLRDAAGNFYINDKPTGAVVGQQPFGGARASGTNDKAGSRLNLMRWGSPRTIKETFDPPYEWRYPYMIVERVER